MKDANFLVHYHERGQPPFRTLTSLPFEEAKAIVCAGLTEKTMFDVDRYLTLRYERDKTLRDMFLSIGGRPVRTAPVYFTLNENEGMTTWFDDPHWIKIPIHAFDMDAVSFTYGDSFAVLNPSLDTGEEWWGKVFTYDGILNLIDQYGYPEDPPYDMKNRVFPKDKHINSYLKFIEAHVWEDAVLEKFF